MIFLTYTGIQVVLIQVLGFTMQVVLSWWLSGKESTYSAGDSKIQAQSQGPEDPLEEEMATHSSILAWEIP